MALVGTPGSSESPGEGAGAGGALTPVSMLYPRALIGCHSSRKCLSFSPTLITHINFSICLC